VVKSCRRAPYFLFQRAIWIIQLETPNVTAARMILLNRVRQLVGDKAVAGPVARCVFTGSEHEVMTNSECPGVNRRRRLCSSGSGMNPDMAEVVLEN
jgi:hypothetical protein